MYLIMMLQNVLTSDVLQNVLTSDVLQNVLTIDVLQNVLTSDECYKMYLLVMSVTKCTY